MNTNAVKLTDLIARNRERHRDVRIDVSTEGDWEPVGELRAGLLPGSGDSASDAPQPLLQDIESLAVKLFSISRQRSADPAHVMREALRSIEACLVAIKRHH